MGVDCHEIAFYYLMKPKGNKNLNSKSVTKGNVKETMHWIPIVELEKYNAYPSFMKEFLMSKHSDVEHIITDERD